MMAVFATLLLYIATRIVFARSVEEYLMTFPNETAASIIAVTGNFEVTCKVKYPILLEDDLTVAANSVVNYEPLIKPDIPTLFGHVTVVFNVESISAMNVYGRQNEATFTPLPVRALGSEYVVSSCHSSGTNSSSLLVITTYNQTMNLEIIFDVAQNVTINGRIVENAKYLYRTVFRFESLILHSNNSLAGTRILSDHSDHVIAVYSGVINQDVVLMYTQLLPVLHLGKTFHVYFDKSRMTYAAQMMYVNSGTDIISDSVLEVGSTRTGLRFKGNGSSELIFSKPTSVMLCGENGVRGMTVLPPQAWFQTEVFLPLDGDTLVIVHPHRQNSVNLSYRSVKEDIRWTFTGEVHVGVVRTPSVPGQSLAITAGESFYVIAASENSIYTAGYSPQYTQSGKVPDPDDNVTSIVSTGTGLSVTAAMLASGAVYIRQRRRRQNRDRIKKGQGNEDSSPPQPPFPPQVPV